MDPVHRGGRVFCPFFVRQVADSELSNLKSHFVIPFSIKDFTG